MKISQELCHSNADFWVLQTEDAAMEVNATTPLDEIAKRRGLELEAALCEMVDSGFGELQEPPAPSPPPAMPVHGFGW